MNVVLAVAVAAVVIAAQLAHGQAPSRPPRATTSAKDVAPMVLIPAGPFTAGINRAKLLPLLHRLGEPLVSFYESELPEATRTLPDYYIDRHEVTNERYDRYLRDEEHRRQSRYAGFSTFNRPQQPVVGIGWEDANRYCRWAGKRLPTEFEWEKAARGTDGRIWPWGNEPDDKKYNGRTQGMRAPIDVGSIPAGDSPYGVSDMAGNVWEMTSSPWPSAEQPTGHVMKGGSYLNTTADVRTMVRWAAQNEREGATWLGFRCAMDARPR